MEEAGDVKKIGSLLRRSVGECLGADGVGVVFSGGVDSTLIALYASEFGRVDCFSVGVEGSPDFTYSESIEGFEGITLTRITLSKEDVVDALPKILPVLSEPNPVKSAVEVPFYYASKKAAEDGLTVMLCGQGADELFGGYNRYLDALAGGGYRQLAGLMDEDVDNLYDTQLKFDEGVCRLNGVKLRAPFMNPEFVEYVKSLPVEDKVREAGKPPEYSCVDEAVKKKYIRKYLLRRVAEEAGVPENILNRSKKAAQYGSGAAKLLDKIARGDGYKRKASDVGRRDYVRMYLEELYGKEKE